MGDESPPRRGLPRLYQHRKIDSGNRSEGKAEIMPATVTITDADTVLGLRYQVNGLTQQVTVLAAESYALRRTLNEIEGEPDMTYGERAEMAGKGPCQRCVGRALADGPSVNGGEVPAEPVTPPAVLAAALAKAEK